MFDQEHDVPIEQKNCIYYFSQCISIMQMAGTVVTELLPAKKFWKAEDKHQQVNLELSVYWSLTTATVPGKAWLFL